MFIHYNPNPSGSYVGDCVIRATSKVVGLGWEQTYLALCMQGFHMFDMPSANRVWGEYLRKNNFRRFIIPDTCPDCYTVKDFCIDHPTGSHVLCTGTHVVAVIDGNYYDSWDSGNEVPIFYYRKEQR